MVKTLNVAKKAIGSVHESKLKNKSGDIQNNFDIY